MFFSFFGNRVVDIALPKNRGLVVLSSIRHGSAYLCAQRSFVCLPFLDFSIRGVICLARLEASGRQRVLSSKTVSPETGSGSIAFLTDAPGIFLLNKEEASCSHGPLKKARPLARHHECFLCVLKKCVARSLWSSNMHY